MTRSMLNCLVSSIHSNLINGTNDPDSCVRFYNTLVGNGSWILFSYENHTNDSTFFFLIC